MKVTTRSGAVHKTMSKWTWQMCADALAKGRNPRERPIGSSQKIVLRDDGVMALRLHSTDIILVSQDNIYTFNSGGWWAYTTKQYANAWAGISIFSHRNEWYHVCADGLYRRVRDGAQFEDGIMRAEVLDRGLIFIARAMLPRSVRNEPTISNGILRKYPKVLAMPAAERQAIVNDAVLLGQLRLADNIV